jgi:hypothetical protein
MSSEREQNPFFLPGQQVYCTNPINASKRIGLCDRSLNICSALTSGIPRRNKYIVCDTGRAVSAIKMLFAWMSFVHSPKLHTSTGTV